jgi:lycopene cyclase domain-containing protein
MPLVRLSYLAMLVFCVLGTLPLEVFLRTRVYARARRLALALLPVLPLFLLWDLYAIDRGHWDFDPEQTSGVLLPGGLPLEEVLFFLVVPTCAVLTLEAVRRVRGWTVGDEAGGVQ